ncbi:MAG: large conductance mechanosensitive channel protein MscL, partial [Candidatus Thermofonsia Clade 3 bacterium]
ARIQYGNFIQAIVNFLIIAAALFFVVKSANAMMRQKQETPAPPPAPSPEVQLLSEIRDLLKEQSTR